MNNNNNNNSQENQLTFFAAKKQNSIGSTQDYEKKEKKHINKKIIWKVFIDGAARGNPGEAGAGIHVVDSQKNIIFQEGFYFGKKTNNQAEYLALAFAACLLQEQLQKESDTIHLHFFSDSELLVKQMNGLYRVKNPILKSIKTSIDSLLKEIPHTFTHVFRENNTKADALANKGVDQKKKLPQKLKKLLSEKNFFVLSPR